MSNARLLANLVPDGLDDYEEGTWTPTFTTSGTNFTSVTYDAISGGQYTKIGNVVYVQGGIRTDAVTIGSASGSVLIGGLPFTPRAFPARGNFSLGLCSDFAGEVPIAASTFELTTTILLFYRSTVDGNAVNTAVGDIGTGTYANRIEFSGCYIEA